MLTLINPLSYKKPAIRSVTPLFRKIPTLTSVYVHRYLNLNTHRYHHHHQNHQNHRNHRRTTTTTVDMPLVDQITLNTGASMPILGLGTWRSEPGQVEKAVEIAIKAGYRSIDTAAAYYNEKEVGDGLHAGLAATGLKREDIFLTTKLPNDRHHEPWDSLQDSLRDLQTDYLDLWLMHWPAPMNPGHAGPNKSLDWLDTWKKIEEIYQAHPELVKAIGISNVYGKNLTRLLENSTITPAINQIEMHPGVDSSQIVADCLANGIKITAYSPLGSDGSKLHENSLVLELAAKYEVTPANILISLQANKPGVSVLAKSVTESRIISNMKLVELTDEEVKKLDAIHEKHSFRVCTPHWTGWGHLEFPVSSKHAQARM